jgi:beta-galactosidase
MNAKPSFSPMKGLLLAVMLPCQLHAERLTELMDTGWRFHLGEVAGARSAAFEDAAWRMLDVPHDWSIEGDYSKTNPTGNKCGYLPSGIGWYRRTLEAPVMWQGKVVTLEFEGVYMNSEVWLNGQRVGGRPYGYISFTCDLTAHWKPGRNVLAVRVDNSLEPSARWYHGCGIYGHVRLIVTDPVHVPYAGVFVTTAGVSAESATLHAAIEVQNSSAAAVDVEVQTEVIAPDGRSVATRSSPAALAADALETVKQELRIARPVLWSVETPALYLLKTRVLRAGEVTDDVTTPFGIRSLRFDANEGFFLNGRAVKLKGVCEHQGGSPVGAAMPEALLERRLQQFKDMGCNSLRAAHNPQLPAFYDLCDRMGILVMDEIFDGWHKKATEDYGGRFFNEWWPRDVTDWVRRDRNHPCVIFWSIGNETGKTDDHQITELIHQLDTTRPTTGGAVIHGVDVAGFNGGIVPSDKVLEDFHRENPTRPIVMTEEPHTFQTRGFYRTVNEIFKPIDELSDYASPEVFAGGHSAYRSSYDNCGRRLVARNCWRRTLDRPWVMGEYRWTGFDYLGEAAWSGNESLAREFNFGVFDLAGFPKDEFYFYQSIWTEKPMVHLLPHWTHPGLEGKTIPVVAYANADEVELFQDGQSLGRQPRSKLFECVWQVVYRPGELKAVAYRAGQVVAQTIQRTAGAPSTLEVLTDNARLKPDRNDLALVSLAVKDAQGTLVPDADHHIALVATGPVRWLGGENGDPVDITPQRETSRNVFHGLSRGFYAGRDGESGPIEVTALGVLGTPYFDHSATVTIACERVALRGALAKQAAELRYTTDGSAPTPDSTLYREPLVLGGTTTVNASLFQDGKALATASSVFKKGPRPIRMLRTTPGEDMGTAEDPTQNQPDASGKKP